MVIITKLRRRAPETRFGELLSSVLLGFNRQHDGSRVRGKGGGGSVAVATDAGTGPEQLAMVIDSVGPDARQRLFMAGSNRNPHR